MEQQRGAALLLTIWAVLLLSVLAGSALLVARGEALRARQLQLQAEARQAADGAIRIALLELASTDAGRAQAVEAQPLKFAIGAFEVDVVVRREAGKIDLNHAPPLLIAELMRQLGHTGDAAMPASAIEAHRNSGSMDGRAFESALDLTGLGGLDAQIAECAVPFTTVYTRAPGPDAAYAAPVVLSAMRAALGTVHVPSGASANAGGGEIRTGELFEITASTRQSDREVLLERQAVVRVTGDPRGPFLAHAWRGAGYAGNGVTNCSPKS